MSGFSATMASGPLAGILRLTSDIYRDVRQDAAVKNATQAWSACMAKNGYTFADPQTAFQQVMQNLYGNSRPITANEQVSTAANQAQIATATSDADCTQSADLAGKYFAVQASYEQQLVNANQQALTAAVRQYRAAYARELSKLPALLRTAKAAPFPRPAGSARARG